VLTLLTAYAAVDRLGVAYVSFSDGVYSYLASRVASSSPSVLYDHLVLSQPPIPVLAASLAWDVHGSTTSVRLMVAALVAATIVGSYFLALACGLTGRWPLLVAALVAADPIRIQYVMLDGEAFLTPLLVLTAWALVCDRRRLVAVSLAVGVLVKLTWVFPAVVVVAAICIRHGLRAGARTAALATGLASLAWLMLAASFGWSPENVLNQLFRAQSGAGWQPVVPLVGILVLVMAWWPMLVTAPFGFRRVPREVALLLAGGLGAIGFMVKAGTFFNVLAPAAPILAVVAVVGLRHMLAQRHAVRICGQVALVGMIVLVVVTNNPWLASSAPLPLGGGLVDVHNASTVRRVASTVEARSAPSDVVFGNPWVALVAHRRIEADQADLFILHALDRAGVPAPASWNDVIGARQDVVVLDDNVEDFAAGLQAVPERDHLHRVLRVDEPPLATTVYAEAARP
jgi:hypothetical protein